MSAKLFIKTPLQKSLFKGGGATLEVLFKLDLLQPSGSFKDRGIGHMIETLVKRDNVAQLITSSGGNAGHAVATAGQKLGIPTDVYVPVTTMPMMIEKIKNRNAKIFVGGANWNEADAVAKKALANYMNDNVKAKYIPPFDDPLIWEGNASIVDELKETMGQDNPPDAIILSVGGGGLLCGIQQGLIKNKWPNVKILAVETQGAASFAAAKAAGKVVSLEKISTIASTLGALAVTGETLKSMIDTKSIVVSDEDAVRACIKYSNEFRHLVEPACGAALSVVYSDHLLHHLHQFKKVVVIVCGGSAVSIDLLHKWKIDFNILDL
eukprot:gene4556-6428_t